MNWDRISGQWERFSCRIRERWGLLTDDDVDAIAGKREHLVDRIQERYSLTREEAQRQVDDWLRENESGYSRRVGG
ncbi:MAG TPA: general stress protein CsbD [Bryobacteraceae bacterium]|nr:general stress protein CsbD [Bryobacteraceae bacterium]HOL70633.1 general stress protein CsbD [Bryobacteraceae bacterium]HOQ45949.1 general stress protein CsbD [Bryobacteraceae bacterium]HPQ17379.1 general stress protein CsbD [Bryobacteraceae bacterium]HPU73232.1 general stress protein CsbD [Bryobacteraceae bacterium]